MGKIVIDDTFWLKISFIVVVFLEAYISGLIPVWSKTCRESPKVLGIANSFASGVFIAIALIHILPEMAGIWANDILGGVEDPFPLPYFLAFVGYTLILIIDKVMFDTHALFDDHQRDPAEEKLQQSIKRSFAQVQLANTANVKSSIVQAQAEIKESMKEYLSSTDRLAARLKASMTDNQDTGVPLVQEISDQEQYFIKPIEINKSSNIPDVQEVEAQAKVDFGELLDTQKPKSQCCNMTPYILMLALSVHAIFEGIALGLAAGFMNTLDIVVAIAIHKGAAGSALGISLVKTFPNDFGIVKRLILLFSLASPLGIAIGILASGAGDIVNVIMSSIAAGTFLYIACTEIIVAEFSVGGNRWWKCLAFILGACIITSLAFIE